MPVKLVCVTSRRSRVDRVLAQSTVLLVVLACRRTEQGRAGPLVFDRPEPTSSTRLAPPPVKRLANMKTPTFEGPQTTSFSYPFASSLRNSQVMVKRRPMAQLTRRGIHYCPPAGAEPVRKRPFALVVSPDGSRGILSWQARNDLLDAQGCAVFKQPGDAVAFDDVAFLAGTPITWAGHAGPDQHSVEADAAARRIEGERFAAVAAFPQVGQAPMSPAVGVQGGRRARHLPSADWITSVAGRAVAAIGGDFTAVLALDSGRLQVWPPVADAQSTALLGAERQLGFVARWVSIVGEHIMLVATDGGGSKLHVYAGDTSALYSVPIPFEVMQPAIAGGGTRVYLAGRGLAALDDGKLTWSQPSEGPVYASTFEDGSLAVAAGKRLDFIKPDGTVAQTFNTEEPLVAPPAIAADGTVWAASATALYIAR